VNKVLSGATLAAAVTCVALNLGFICHANRRSANCGAMVPCSLQLGQPDYRPLTTPQVSKQPLISDTDCFRQAVMLSVERK
jgi:hypothetical protein